MRPRIKVITLGVSDLEKSLAFYRDGMGLATEGIIGTEFEDGAVVFYEMNDDLILALWPQKSLAKDAKIAVGPPSPTEFSIGFGQGAGHLATHPWEIVTVPMPSRIFLCRGAAGPRVPFARLQRGIERRARRIRTGFLVPA